MIYLVTPRQATDLIRHPISTFLLLINAKSTVYHSSILLKVGNQEKKWGSESPDLRLISSRNSKWTQISSLGIMGGVVGPLDKCLTYANVNNALNDFSRDCRGSPSRMFYNEIPSKFDFKDQNSN